MIQRIALLILAIAMPAHAQWGVGTAMGTGCPYNFRPAPQATNGADEVANINGYMQRDRQMLANRERDLAAIDSRLNKAKADMGRVIRPPGMTAIDQHYSHGLTRDRYQTACTGGAPGASGAPTVLPPWAGGNPGPAPADAGFPVPSGFCYRQDGRYLNLWSGFMADDAGRLNPSICEYPVPPGPSPDPNAVSACKNALRDYYAIRADRQRVEDDLRAIRERMAGYDARLRVVRDEVTEGRYCPTCNAERRGYATASAGNQTMQMVGLVANVAMGLMNRNHRPPQGPAVLPPRPGAPAVMPYRAYPQRPYSAPMPGYYGMNNGVDYGAVPGGIGPGAFGCQGTSPLNASPMFGSPPPTIFGGPSPWSNPYAAPFMNPQLGNPMYNSGFAPTILPMIDSLLNGFGSPGGLAGPDYWNNPYNNPFGPPTQYPNQFGPPGTLPYWAGYTGNNGLYNPALGADPFGYNPYAGNNWGWPGSSYYDPYNPYAGVGSGAPAVLPYTGSLSAVANANYPGAFGSPVSTYYNQMQQIKQNINVIQNGSYFSGSAPTVLPYNGTTPIYNRPGTLLNPAPPILPYKNK